MNTNYRGIWRRIRGSCRALAEQATSKNYTADDAYNDMKKLSVFEGLPEIIRRVIFKGKVREWKEPISMANATDENCYIVMNTIQCFADERNLYLYEYHERFPNDPDAYPYRSVGGRTQAEMIEYCNWLEKCGDVELARKLRQKPRWHKKEKGATDLSNLVFSESGQVIEQKQSEMFTDKEMGEQLDIY